VFRGRYQHTIDPKGRLSIPARFRDVLAQFDGHLVVVPNDHALEVHPIEDWERIESKLREQSIFNPEVRDISRLYISRAMDATIDAAGRILITPDVRQQAGLQREVTLLGGGLRHFEIWDRQRFEEYERTRSDRLPSLFEQLARLGV